MFEFDLLNLFRIPLFVIGDIFLGWVLFNLIKEELNTLRNIRN